MTPEYFTVYQIASDPNYSSFARLDQILPFIVAAPLVLGSIILLAGKIKFHWKHPHWLLAPILPLIAILLIRFLWPGNIHRDQDAWTAFQKSDYLLVEGRVTHFDPMPYEGHKEECFTVNDSKFCYSDYEIEPGFRNTASHGGPIREGLQVRIAYKPTFRRNMILRLEISRNPSMPPQ